MTTEITQRTEKYTLHLGKVAYYGTRRINAVDIDLEIRAHKSGATEVSLMGGIWNGPHTDYVTCGQITEILTQLFRGSRKVRRIVALWDRWHLNTMHAGTQAQEDAIRAWQATGARYDYTAACDHLQSVGLLIDNGYRYGSAWLTEEVPADVLTELRTLFGATL